jgi:hypothetical protein
MASDGGERRMVFDIRGRRRIAVKVVYAVLAVLMGASLFLVVGPVNIGELFGENGSSSSEAAKQFEQQAHRIEAKLAKDPEDPELLLSLTRSRITAGNSLVEVNAEGQKQYSPEALQQLQKASQNWSEYLKAVKKPDAGAAQLMAPTFFTLAELSTGLEILANLEAAVEAQEIVAKQRPTLNSLSTLAIYRTFTFDYDGAQNAADEAKKFAGTKFERENLDNQLEETKKRAESFQSQLAAYKKQLKQQQEAGGGGSLEGLENPFSSEAGALGG